MSSDAHLAQSSVTASVLCLQLYGSTGIKVAENDKTKTNKITRKAFNRGDIPTKTPLDCGWVAPTGRIHM